MVEYSPGQSTSFGSAADEYERGRPEYPADAAAWLVPDGAKTAVDLGAGTGKFTRSLVALGLHVVAIEPDPKMRAKLTAVLPQVEALEGSAENIPLPDDSADIVTAAQAWHWVDQSLALPEVSRVLVPGGALALVWNVQDERVDWIRGLNSIMGKPPAELWLSSGFSIGAPFGPTEHFEVEWTTQTDLEGMLGLVASRSDFIIADADYQGRVMREVRELVSTHPDLRGRSSFDVPYLVHVFRAFAPAAQ